MSGRFYISTTYKEDEDGNEIWNMSTIKYTEALEGPPGVSNKNDPTPIASDKPIVSVERKADGNLEFRTSPMLIDGNKLFIIIEKLKDVERMLSQGERT